MATCRIGWYWSLWWIDEVKLWTMCSPRRGAVRAYLDDYQDVPELRRHRAVLASIRTPQGSSRAAMTGIGLQQLATHKGDVWKLYSRTPCGQSVDFTPPSLAAWTYGKPVNNIPVAHRFTTLIHRLPTLRRSNKGADWKCLRRNNNKFFRMSS